MCSQNDEITLGPAFLWGLWIVLFILQWFIPSDVDISFGEEVILFMVMAGVGVLIFSVAPFGISLLLIFLFIMVLLNAVFSELWGWVNMLLILGILVGLAVAAEETRHLNARLWRMRWSSRSSVERLTGQRFNGIGPNRWDK